MYRAQSVHVRRLADAVCLVPCNVLVGYTLESKLMSKRDVVAAARNPVAMLPNFDRGVVVVCGEIVQEIVLISLSWGGPWQSLSPQTSQMRSSLYDLL